MNKLFLASTIGAMLLLQIQAAQASCYCGTYRFPHNSSLLGSNDINDQYKIEDGALNPLLLMNNFRVYGSAVYVGTEIQMVWSARDREDIPHGSDDEDRGVIPTLDKIATSGAVVCVKGSVKSANVEGSNVNYFESIEDVFPANSHCRGTPLHSNLAGN